MKIISSSDSCCSSSLVYTGCVKDELGIRRASKLTMWCRAPPNGMKTELSPRDLGNYHSTFSETAEGKR